MGALSIAFVTLGVHVCIQSEHAELANIFRAKFAAFPAPASQKDAADLDYAVRENRSGGSWSVFREGRALASATDFADVLFHLEKDLLIAVQYRRPELLYLHAAALERDGRVLLLVGESGAGKSTISWGLLHHGFRYLSDELSPVEPETRAVHPYPQALCLKTDPPADYPLPSGRAVDLRRTIHVPVAAMPAALSPSPARLESVLFVRHDARLSAPHLRALTRAEAAARAYVNTLNALAHPARGINAVLRLVQDVPCWEMQSSDLAATCHAIADLVKN